MFEKRQQQLELKDCVYIHWLIAAENYDQLDVKTQAKTVQPNQLQVENNVKPRQSSKIQADKEM